jgi:hypothetical protein
MRGGVTEKMQKINSYPWLSFLCTIKGAIHNAHGSSSYIFYCPHSNKVGGGGKFRRLAAHLFEKGICYVSVVLLVTIQNRLFFSAISLNAGCSKNNILK